MSEKCVVCRFYFDDCCRRYPPTVNVTEAVVEGTDWHYDYPIVNDDQWCGEFQAIPVTPDDRRDELISRAIEAKDGT